MTLLDREAAPARGGDQPSAWWRARARVAGLDDRWRSWLACWGVALLAFGLRLWHLGTPHEFAFDETYYAKDAWSMANFGYVRAIADEVGGQPVNDAILDGRTQGLWPSGDPAMIVHPEAAKWLIALGEKAFGFDPFGWRIASAVVGALMVLVLCRLARRLTGSTMLGCFAGLLLTFDGLHFVLSRLALLDIFLAFFLLLALSCVVADRDWYRARLARLLDPDDPLDGSDWGPVRRALWRPWLVAAGVWFGLAAGTKWDAVYPLAAFGLLVWLWSAGARRSFGVRRSVLRSAVVDGLPAFAQLVLVALFVYVASWTGWLLHADDYERTLSSTQYTGFVKENGCVGTGDDRRPDNVSVDKTWPTATEPDAHGPMELVQSLRSLWYYHHDVYVFHTHFLNCSEHVYQSQPSGWPMVNRPVGAATDLTVQPGEQGCTAEEGETCYRQVLIIGTPVLWWGCAIGLAAAAVLWVGTRDWRYGVAVVGALTTWLPWLMYDDRPIFFYYAIAYIPFAILATTLALGALMGRSREPSGRRTAAVVVGGAFLVLVLLDFAFLYPILSYEVIPRDDWLHRMWFRRWI